MTEVHLRNRQTCLPVDLRVFRQIALAAIAQDRAGLPGRSPCRYHLGICLVTARVMTELNETYLRHQGPTDVMAFDYLQGEAASIRERGVHGDIFICADEALTQSTRYRTTWQAELVRYLVHGLLHLRGFEDNTPSARRAMKREEDRRLRRLASQFGFDHLAKRGGARGRPAARPRALA
jgi:rRNA maturation RNase YbeY